MTNRPVPAAAEGLPDTSPLSPFTVAFAERLSRLDAGMQAHVVRVTDIMLNGGDPSEAIIEAVGAEAAAPILAKWRAAR